MRVARHPLSFLAFLLLLNLAGAGRNLHDRKDVHETRPDPLAKLLRDLKDSFTPAAAPPGSEQELDQLRKRVKRMFYHAYDNYIMHAFPHDELLPLSCSFIDNFGSYALTLVDSLDMLAVLGNRTEFARAVGLLKKHLSFDKDVQVSVFETNIRVLGGLLSSHLLARDPKLKLMDDYDGFLLKKALELGERLLPAFDTPTGIPYGTINLRSGVAVGETTITSSACAGTLMLEFGMLSRLSGRGEFERVAKRSLLALWSRRSSMGLIGAHLDIMTGQWTHKDSGVGTSIDSFYEYLIKSYILYGEDEFLFLFQQAYHSAKALLAKSPWYVDVNMESAQLVWPIYNSLQSFWPAIEVIAGNLKDASETHSAFYGVWRRYGYTPEGYNLADGRVQQGQRSYPLRPELIESTMYLYQATRDPHYVQVGRDILSSLEQTRVPCGHAAIEDVETHLLQDKMDSFFLSETLKYLYLLFTPRHWALNGSFVFSTEGHPLPLQQLPGDRFTSSAGFSSLPKFPNPFYDHHHQQQQHHHHHQHGRDDEQSQDGESSCQTISMKEEELHAVQNESSDVTDGLYDCTLPRPTLCLDRNASMALEELQQAKQMLGSCASLQASLKYSHLDLEFQNARDTFETPIDQERVGTSLQHLFQKRERRRLGLLPAWRDRHAMQEIIGTQTNTFNVQIQLPAGGMGNIWETIGAMKQKIEEALGNVNTGQLKISGFQFRTNQVQPGAGGQAVAAQSMQPMQMLPVTSFEDIGKLLGQMQQAQQHAAPALPVRAGNVSARCMGYSSSQLPAEEICVSEDEAEGIYSALGGRQEAAESSSPALDFQSSGEAAEAVTIGGASMQSQEQEEQEEQEEERYMERDEHEREMDESQKEVQKLYDLYDQDQNLRLSHSELHTMLHSSFGSRMVDSLRILKTWDLDQDYTLSRKEVARWYVSYKEHGFSDPFRASPNNATFPSMGFSSVHMPLEVFYFDEKTVAETYKILSGEDARTGISNS